MALGELASVLPSEVLDKFSNLVLILKALGVLAIIYVLYLIVTGVLNYRRTRKIENIEKKTEDIEKKIVSVDKKLNKLLKKRG